MPHSLVVVLLFLCLLDFYRKLSSANFLFFFLGGSYGLSSKGGPNSADRRRLILPPLAREGEYGAPVPSGGVSSGTRRPWVSGCSVTQRPGVNGTVVPPSRRGARLPRKELTSRASLPSGSPALPPQRELSSFARPLLEGEESTILATLLRLAPTSPGSGLLSTSALLVTHRPGVGGGAAGGGLGQLGEGSVAGSRAQRSADCVCLLSTSAFQ